MTKAVRPQRKNLIAHMNIMSVQPMTVNQNQSNSISNSDSNGSDLFMHIGHYHYKRMVNGDIDQEFNVPIVVESTADLDSTISQIRQKIVDGEIQITIHKKTEYWDDIPSPSQEDLDRAIAICDSIPMPDPIVPETQQTNSPSWDSE